MIFNISNRHLDLEPQMAALAQSIGWSALQFNDRNIDRQEGANGKTMSHWVILARKKSDLGNLQTDTRWLKLREKENLAPWTDNYSSLLSVFNWS